MPDLVTSVQIIAQDQTGAAYAAASANSDAFAQTAQANATQFGRIRSEEEAVEASWIEALEENAAREAEAAASRAAAEEAAAARIVAAAEKQKEVVISLGRTIAAAAEGGGIAGILGGAGELVGFAIVAGLLEHMVDKTKDAAIELGHMATATGESAEKLEEFEMEMDRMGVKGVNLQMTVMRLSAAMQQAKDPSSEASRTFKALGVDTAALVAGTLSFADVEQQMAIHLANSTKTEEDLANARRVAGRNVIELVAFLKDEGTQLQANMESHHGAAAAMAGSIQAAMDLQKSEADLHEVWKEASAKILPAVAGALRTLMTVMEAVKVGWNNITESVRYTITTTWEEVVTLSKVTLDFAKGNITQAAADAKAGNDKMEAEAQRHAARMVSIVLDGYQSLSNIWAKGEEHKPTGETDTTKEGKSKLTAEIATQQAIIDSDAAHQKAGLELKRISYEEEEKLGKISADANLARLIDLNNEELEIEQDAIRKKSALEATLPGGGGAKTTKLQGELRSAADKTIEENARLQARVTEEDQHAEKERITFLAKFWVDVDKENLKGFDRELATGKKAMEEKKRVSQIESTAEVSAAKYTADMRKLTIDAAYEQGTISLKERIRLLKEVEDAEYKAAMMAAQVRLAAETTAAPSGVKTEGMAKAAADIQKLTQTHDLAIVKLNIDSAKASEAPWLSYFKSIGSSMNSGINSWITGHEKFRKALQSTWRSIATEALTSLERIAEDWVVKHLLMAAVHKLFYTQKVATEVTSNAITAAAHSTTNSAEATGDAGLAAAAAFSSVMQALPFPANVVVAPVVAAAALAQGMALAGIAAFEKGGMLPQSGGPFLGILHPGERVLNRQETQNYNSGGNRTQSYSYHAAPGESPGSSSRGLADFQRLIRDGRVRSYA